MKIAIRRGVTASLVCAAFCAAPMLSTSAHAAEPASAPAGRSDDCPAPRVTGISALLDAFSTGSAAGPSVFYGIALAALSQPLPEPFGTAQAEFLSQGAEGVEQMRTDAPAQIDQLRTVVAPFSRGNEFANQGVDAFADGLDTLAGTGGKAIAPSDMTLRQIAVLVRTGREAPPKPC